jgi:uncharacterized protein (TIGR03067 family)
METCLVMVVGLTLMAAAADATAKHDEGRGDDVKNIIGNWSCVSATVDGKPLGEKVVASLRLKMTAERYRTERDGEVLFDSTYKLDQEKSPRWIEMIGTEGDAAGKAGLGIYKLDGDSLTMCYTMPGGQRPKEFESAAGSGRFLIVWRREKK